MANIQLALPVEIWSKILDYLPPDQCRQLRLANRFFFHLTGRQIYKRLFVTGYDQPTKHLLKAINSLCLGHHVQSLRIQPWIVAPLVQSQPRRRRERVSSAFQQVYSFFDSAYPTRKAQALQNERLNKQIQIVTETIRKLPHVREYTVDWDVDRPYHSQLFTAVLTLLNVTPFSQTLTTLTLTVPVDRLVCLAPVHLPALEELSVCFVTQGLSQRYIDDCLDSFIFFLDNLYKTLRSLSICSTHRSPHLNLSKFFHNLSSAFFPRLHSFALRIPYDGSHLPRDTNGIENLRAFISKHGRIIHHLKLSAFPRPSIRTSPSDPMGKYWIQGTLSGPGFAESLTALTSLELSIRPLRSDLDPFLTFLSSVNHRLDSLALLDDPLTPEEVVRVLDTLSLHSPSYLRHLSIRLQYLSPCTLDRLASRLACLKSLRLTFGDIKSSHCDEKNDLWLSRLGRELVSLFRFLIIAIPDSTYPPLPKILPSVPRPSHTIADH
ncbi:hypothetical protein D9757_011992 [Collybiopsis confluens]|uniref:F-box domain-containing protein n=1 Tax=Collybiopsis confluens TaxID=2823264 RepID=A0A8H5LU66_9AGAR|nr:hypothetical protein D9757_011992 [Collybiopsis confluens]